MATSDISALLEQAKCFRCLSHKELVAVQTYIIAYASNQGMDPSTLLNEARCLLCLSQKRLFQIRAYLIANIGGLSTDPQELADLAQCYRCIPDGYMEAVRAYLLSQDPNGPGTSDPDVLEANAATFTGLTPEQSLAIQVYLLANNAGLSTDPGELQDLAKCFDCLSFEVLNSVTTQVVDEVESDGGISGGGGCVDVPAQQIPVITGIYTDGILTGLSILLPQVCCDPLSVTIYEADDAIGTGAVAIATGLIDDSHAGEINYTLPDYTFGSTPAKDYVLVTQNCQDGTESGYSNAVGVDGTCGEVGTVIAVTGAGDTDANGLYAWQQDEFDSSGRFTYFNNITGYMIEFVNGTGGVEAWLYDAVLSNAYRLPLGECFPCGAWTVGGGDSGTLPAPTCVWATVGETAAAHWTQRVIANGGAVPSGDSEEAIATFGDALDTAGIFSKMRMVNVVAPDSLIAAATPLIPGPGNNLWTTVGTIGLNRDGVIASANNSYYKTGFVPSTHFASQANGGLTTYIPKASWASNHVALGSNLSGNPNSCDLVVRNFTLTNQTVQYPSSTQRIDVGRTDYNHGYHSMNRVANNDLKWFFKGPRNAHGLWGANANLDLTGAPAFELYAMTRNVSNVANSNVANEVRYSFFAAHDGLIEAESLALCNAIETLRKAFGGGWLNSVTETAATVVNTWASTVEINGGAAPSAATKAAFETFWDALITAGIDDKMIVVMPFPADNLTAARIPLFRTLGPTVWTNNNFVAGDLTVNGLAGNDTTKYLDSDIAFDDFGWGAFDFGLTMYDYTGITDDLRFVDWHIGSGFTPGIALFYFVGSTFYYSGDNANNLAPANANFRGYQSGSRTANNVTKLYKANSTTAHVEIGSNAGVQTDFRGASSNRLSIFVDSLSGAHTDFTAHRYSFFAFHRGLTSSESSDFYDAVQALRTALGGGYV